MKLTIDVKHNANPKLQPIIHNALWHAARNPAWEVRFIEDGPSATTIDEAAHEKN